ncbi:MAG TPA: hypothetical protein VNX28_12340 [Gemmataceae bacterium]|nr:hypothetical protein [Gemmataceae bacterium]
MENSESGAGPVVAPGPWAEYACRLAGRQAEAARLARRAGALDRSRAAALAIVVGLAWLAEKERLLPVLLVLPIALFLVYLYRRNRTRRLRERTARASAFYARRLDRLTDRWAGTGEQGTAFLQDNHPCAADLDLFGPGSLFERLHLAGTPLGAKTLAGWLRTPAGPAQVRARQAAVAELRDRLDLREDLAVLGAAVPTWLDSEALAAWGRGVGSGSNGIRLAAVGLAILSLIAFIAWAWGVSPVPLLGMLALEGALAVYLRGRTRRVLAAAPPTGVELTALAAVFARVEQEPFTCPLLRRLTSAPGPAASRRLASLGRLLNRRALTPLTFPLLGATRLALALERWHSACGAAMAGWLAALGDLEALCALAAYAYENPDDTFPDVVAEGPRFEADGLGHPLLPAARCVRNNLRLDAEVRVLVVSGSNMSGKSTLLRAVGANAVLALAGGPVRARKLCLAPLTVGATLRVQDSLLGGQSRFFAEVTRIRRLLELARAGPHLFLLDELFSGTNSDDRRVGAEAVVHCLLDAGAIGLLTTHDLALTRLAETLPPRVANVHFAEQFEGDVMTFDYLMRPGVPHRSNGLALMRALGIEV